MAVIEKKSIALIGPMSAGKSTVGKLLAEALGISFIEADEYRWTYFEEIGYDYDHVKQIMTTGGGYPEMFAYWKPFEVHLVERIVEDHPGTVIDFGAGHTVHDDPDNLKRVKQALAQCGEVFLLLPYKDKEASLEILNARLSALIEGEIGFIPEGTLEQNHYFVEHAANYNLATEIVYTSERTPEEVCKDLLSRLN